MNNYNPQPVNMCGCAPGPAMLAVYDSFEAAVAASDLVFLKPGQVHTAFYREEDKYHCVISIGNIIPSEKHFIISDTGRDVSYSDQIAEILRILGEKLDSTTFELALASINHAIESLTQNINEINAEIEKIVPEEDIKALFENSYVISVTGSNAGIVSVTPLKSLYDDGEVVVLTAEAKQGYEFAGWYIDNVLQTTDLEYNYSVTKNEVIRIASSENDLGGVCALFASYQEVQPIVKINEQVVNSDVNRYNVSRQSDEGTLIMPNVIMKINSTESLNESVMPFFNESLDVSTFYPDIIVDSSNSIYECENKRIPTGSDIKLTIDYNESANNGCKPFEFVQYIITAKNPNDIANWPDVTTDTWYTDNEEAVLLKVYTDISIEAVFKAVRYNLEIVNDESKGQTEGSASNVWPLLNARLCGTRLKISVKPNEGETFEKWSIKQNGETETIQETTAPEIILKGDTVATVGYINNNE